MSPLTNLSQKLIMNSIYIALSDYERDYAKRFTIYIIPDRPGINMKPIPFPGKHTVQQPNMLLKTYIMAISRTL